MKTIIINLVIAYFAFAFFAYFFSNALIFLPQRAGYKDSQDFIKLTTKDGATIFAVFLPNEKAQYTLLVSHGNAEDIGMMMPFLRKFREHGFQVFAYDYHGYGLSSGKPTEKNTYLDIDAAYEYLTKQLGIPPSKIIDYGRSLGGAVALDLAVRQPVKEVILESSFVTAFRVVTRIPLLPFDKFSNITKITKLKVPVLIIHGTYDKIIPFWHGKKLFDAAPQPKQFLEVQGAGHNNVSVVGGELYWKMLREIIKNEK